MQCSSVLAPAHIVQNIKFEAMPDKGKAAAEAAEKDGTRVRPGIRLGVVHVKGPDKEHPRTHHDRGSRRDKHGSAADNNKQGGVSIMNAGTSTAHLMTPAPRI